MVKTMTHRGAGVNINAGDNFVKAIAPLVERTWDRYVIPNFGGFAGIYKLGERIRDEIIEGFLKWLVQNSEKTKVKEAMEGFARYLVVKYGKENVTGGIIRAELYRAINSELREAGGGIKNGRTK